MKRERKGIRAVYYSLGVMLLMCCSVCSGCQKAGKTSVVPKLTVTPEVTEIAEVTEKPTEGLVPVPTKVLTLETANEPTGMPDALPTEIPAEPTEAPIRLTEIPVEPTESVEKITAKPTKNPVKESISPTAEPVKEPTPKNTPVPTGNLVKEPTPKPTPVPTGDLLKGPTPKPTPVPTRGVVKEPTGIPTKIPTRIPTVTPVPMKDAEEGSCRWDELATEVVRALEMDNKEKSSLELMYLLGVLKKEEVDRKEFPSKADVYVLLYRLAMKNGEIPDEKADEIIKKEKRLTDLAGCSDEERKAAYFLYRTGIVEGKSNGNYSGTRKLEMNARVSKEEMSLYLRRLFGKEKRRVLTADGRLTRTTDLPEFAEFYEYILDDFPNEFYAWEFQYMKYEGGYVPEYTAPCEMKTTKKKEDSYTYGEVIETYGTQYADFVEEYLGKIFNVDYRKTPEDPSWYEYMYDRTEGNISYAGKNGPEFLKFRLNQYLSDIQENHTVLECDLAVADPSAMYVDGIEWVVRCYIHYRIVSADSTKMIAFYRGQLEFSELFVGDYRDVKLGEWRDGYLDVTIRPEPDKGEVYVREVMMSDYLYFTRVKYKK